MESITIFQSFVNIRTVDDYFDCLVESLKSDSPTTFFYLNTYSSYLCDIDPGFKKAFNSSDFIIPDGMSIVFALKLLYNIRAEKVTVNHTFIERMAAFFDKEGISLFLLGSTTETLHLAKAKFARQYPGIVIAGMHHGYLRRHKETEEVISLINSAKPTVLFVGMGMPISELWIYENKHRLNVPCILPVGNLIEIIAGKRRIAPRWLMNTGMEWMYRLQQEPFRLTPRYIKTNSRYLLDLFNAFITRHIH